MKRRIVGTKASVTTLAIKAGLVCPVDGQIFTTNLMRDLTTLLKDNGYAMNPTSAYKKVKAFADHLGELAYGN